MNSEYLRPIANHLWQSTVFAAIAGLLTLALRKNHARVRHAVWFAASCKFLIPISLLIMLGSQFTWRTTPVTPNISVVVNEVSQPFTTPVFAASAVQPTANPLSAILLIVWLCGFIGISASWLVRWLRIRAAIRTASPVNLGLPIEARISRTLIEPGIFGVLHPVLLLPEGIADRLTPEQLKAVIAHELCHVRHQDNLTATIQMFIETVFWFHPLVWWIGKRMVAEREQACDEEVLQRGSEPRVYAQSILNVCKLYTESPLACVPGITGSNLRARIEAIMKNRSALRLNVVRKTTLAIACILAVATPVFIGMIHVRTIRAQAPRPADAVLQLAVSPAAPVQIAQVQTPSIKPTPPPPAEETGARVNATRPEFDAASVKPTDPNSRTGLDFRITGGRLVSTHWTLELLVREAYGVMYYQVSGGPAWFKTDNFDIEATAGGDATRDQMLAMLRTLLEDRFKLRVHRENREGNVYVLSVAKGGQKLKPPAKDTDRPMVRVFRNTPTDQRGVLYTNVGQNATVSQLTDSLSNVVHAPVRDQTGIAGNFDFRYDYATLDAPVDAGPSIFSSVQEQLGLKLEAQKGPVEFLVVDHAEKPGAN